MGLFPDEDLSGEGTEFALREIGHDAGGGVADLLVREDDRRRNELGNVRTLDHGAAAAFGEGRVLGAIADRSAGEIEVDVAVGIALERAGLDPLQRTGAIPRALVIRIEYIAFGIESDPAGRAHAARGGDEFAIVRDAQDPAAVKGLGGEGSGEAEGAPEIALLVELRAEGVFVVVALDAPSITDRLEEIGAAVAVLVLETRHFGTLHHVEPAVAPGESEGLVEVFGEEGPFGGFVRMIRRVLDDPDLAAAGADRDLAIGEQLDATALDRGALGSREVGDGVEVGFLRSLGEEVGGEEGEEKKKGTFHGPERV